MLFRSFVLPVLPMLLLVVDYVANGPTQTVVLAAIAAVTMAMPVLPSWIADYTQPVSDNRIISVAEMKGFPGVTTDVANRAAGNYLRTLFEGLDVRLGIGGGHANLAYRAHVPTAIEVAAGLTDAYIAHLPLPPRGKVGHERPWPL